MNDFIKYGRYFVFGIIALMWLYIAARMITRGVMRSIQEWKERKRNG